MYEFLKRQAVQEKMKINVAYGDHPAIQERIRSTTEIVAREYTGKEGRQRSEEFMAATVDVLLDNAELDLKRANYVLAQQGLTRYAARKQADARACYLQGELYREKGPQHSDEKARESYREAIALKAGYAEPYRSLGLLEFAAGNKAEAKRNFEQYLALQPAAADRDYIRQYIRARK